MPDNDNGEREQKQTPLPFPPIHDTNTSSRGWMDWFRALGNRVSGEGQIQGRQLTNRTLSGDKLELDSITSDLLGPGSVIPSKVEGWFQGALGDEFPSDPNDGDPFYRTDLQQTFQFDSNEGDWVGISSIIDTEDAEDLVITKNLLATTANIIDASIISAKIADLAVTDAKIDSLNVNKLTGDIITGKTLRTAAEGARFEVSAIDNQAIFFNENDEEELILGHSDSLLDSVLTIVSASQQPSVNVDNSFSEGLSGRFRLVESDGTVRNAVGMPGAVSLSTSTESTCLSLTEDSRTTNITVKEDGILSVKAFLNLGSWYDLVKDGETDSRATLVFATKTTGGSVSYGNTANGEDLSPSNIAGDFSSLTLSGTWRCLGHAPDTSTDTQTTLWLKISDN